MIGLAPDERAMLDGKEGLAKRKAMELLVKYAEALGAEKFINTNNVTLTAGTLPDLPLVQRVVPNLDADEIASKFYFDSDDLIVLDKVKAFSTTNSYFIDQRYPELQRGGVPACELSKKMMDYCKRVGIVHLATCTPYQSGNIPIKGEHCAWTESHAIAFCNSVIGARTNIEGQHSSFCSAVTGKTPLWGMHLDENRLGKVIIDVQLDMELIRDWYLMGYYVGKYVGLDNPIYININKRPDLTRLMALCSSGIASGSIVMFHIVGVTPEAPSLEVASGNKKGLRVLEYGNRERKEAYEKLNHSERTDVDIVVLGCPHYTLERFAALSRMLEGKRIHENTALYVTTCRSIRAIADRMGYTEVITKAGALVLEDTCGNIFNLDPSKVLASDSAKMVHYIPGMTGLKNTLFGTTEECVQAAITGKWRGELR